MALPNMTARAPTLADLQAQLRQVQAQHAQVGSANSSDEVFRNQNRQLQLVQQIQQMQGGGAGGDPMAEDLAAIRALTEGRAGDLQKDPYNQSVMDFLQGVTTGKDVPFTNEVQGAMLAQQGKGFSDAEASSMEALRQGLQASGGSIYDPSYQAASREAASQRQGQNLDAAGRMASQAGLANFDARMGGAGQLSAARNAQNAQVNQMNLAGAGYRARSHQDTTIGGQQQTRPVAAPITNNYTYNGGAQQAMATPTAPTAPTAAAPARTAAPVSQRPAPSVGASQNVPLPPTQQQLTTPWNAANLNPYATLSKNAIIRPDPDDQPYIGRSSY